MLIQNLLNQFLTTEFCKVAFRKSSTNWTVETEIQVFIGLIYLQGPPLGFDIKYLTLVDRNMQVRFGLKVVWES